VADSRVVLAVIATARASLVAGVVALTATVLAAPTAAQMLNAAAVSNPDSALAVELGKIQGDSISLDGAIQTALNGGSAAALEAAALVRAAKGELRHQKGAFDPDLFGAGAREKASLPFTSPFIGTETDRTSATAGVRALLPFGTEVEASMDGAKLENNSTFSTVNPQYNAAGRISINQPLLSGFGPGTSGDLTAAKLESQAALFRYDDVMLGVRTLVEEVYWDLYAAQRDLAVQRLIRRQAEAFVTEAQARARSGLVGPEDVANARVFLASQTAFEIDFEERLDNVSDGLGSLIGRRPARGLERFLPSDEPPSDFPIEPVDSLVARAMSANHELQAQESQVAATQARAKGAKWNAYPTFNLFGSLGGLGLAGTGQSVTIDSTTYTPTESGGFGDAWSEVWNRDFPTWSAGMALSIPIGFRAGLGDYDRIRAEADRQAEALERSRRIVADNVRIGYRALLNARRRLDAAKMGVDASRDQVRIGILQYNNGRTTAFELVRLGTDLATANQRYSRVLVLTAKAAAALRFLTSGAYPGPISSGGSTTP